MRVSPSVHFLLPSLLGAASACFLTGPENQPPTVTITQPVSQYVTDVGDTIEVVAEASDSDGVVVSVTFFVDGTMVAQDFESPYTLAWDTHGVAGYYHLIRVVAEDDSGAEATRSRAVYTSWVYEQPELVDDGWETASLASVGMDPVPLVTLMNLLRDHEEHRIHGILIAVGGSLVFEQYFAGHRRNSQDVRTSFGRDTIHDLASVTKSVTSTMLGIAIYRGLVTNVQQPLFDFFPEYADLNDGTKDGITLEHVVTMTAGLEWNETSFALTDDRNDLVQFNQSNDPLGFALAKPMVAVPGTVFAYSGANFMLLGDAIRRASGVRLDRLAQEFLFTPLGIDVLDWKYYPLISPDLVAAHGDLELRPRDMLKIGQLYLQQGLWNGERILPPEWVQASVTPYYSFPNRLTGQLEGFVGYSYGWWVRSQEFGAGAFSASGWGGQEIIVLPAFDAVVVCTGGAYWDPPLLWPHEVMVEYVLPSLH